MGQRKGKGILTPEGIVRPGDSKPYRKGTAQEIEKRVEYCARLLVPGFKTKTEVHKAMKRRYALCWGVVDDIYIPRARKWLADRATMSAGEAKRTGVNYLIHVMRTGTRGEGLRAEQRLAEIYGYNAPRRHEVTGAGGEPLVPERSMRHLATDELLRIAYGEAP